MKTPNDVGRVFNVAGFFEGFKGNTLGIVETIKRADDDESGVGLSLEVFKLANNLVNSLLGGNIGNFDRNDLKVVKNENGSFIFAKSAELKNKVVDVVFLKFKNVKIEVGRFKLGNNVLKRWRSITAANTGGS